MADGTTDTPTTDTPAPRRDAFDDVDYADVVGVAAPLRGAARVAASTQEAWAPGALIALTGACDGAKEADSVGFNKGDILHIISQVGNRARFTSLFLNELIDFI